MSLFTLLPLAGIVVAWIVMRRVRNSTVEPQPLTELTRNERIVIWVLSFVDPLIAGAIFYYGWKSRFPKKARSANRISWIALGLLIVLGVAVGYYQLKTGTGPVAVSVATLSDPRYIPEGSKDCGAEGDAQFAACIQTALSTCTPAVARRGAAVYRVLQSKEAFCLVFSSDGAKFCGITPDAIDAAADVPDGSWQLLTWAFRQSVPRPAFLPTDVTVDCTQI